MSYFDQAEFADNPEPRCPVVLCLDTSGSMKGDPVEQLNTALQQFSQELKDDSLASLRVEVAVVTFGGSVRARRVAVQRVHGCRRYRAAGAQRRSHESPWRRGCRRRDR